MTFTGLLQADAYAQQKGLVVVGYYQGADTVQHINRPDTLAKLVADKIASKFAQACILLVCPRNALRCRARIFISGRCNLMFRSTTRSSRRPSQSACRYVFISVYNSELYFVCSICQVTVLALLHADRAEGR